MLRLLSIRKEEVSRKGLSLLELVVVLGILALIAGITIQSLGPLADQARYDSTVQSLQALENSLYQEHTSAQGRIAVRGYLADMGTLPMLTEIDGVLSPLELLSSSAPAFRTYHLSEPEFDDHSHWELDSFRQQLIAALEPRGLPTVLAGWNGPYVRTTPGRNPFVDGWGNPFRFENNDLTQIATYGSDNDPGSNASTYAGTISVAPPTRSLVRVQLETLGGEPLTPAAGQALYLAVMVFGPKDGSPARLFPASLDTLAPNQDLAFYDNNFAELSCGSLTPGPRTFVVAIIEKGTSDTVDQSTRIHWVDWRSETIVSPATTIHFTRR